MKLAIRLILLAIAIGLCVWLWIYLHPTPQEAVRRQLVALAKIATLEKREGNAIATLRADEFSGFFGREVALNMEPRTVFPDSIDRSEIARTMLFIRTTYRSLDVKILDPVITIGADQKSAIVELTVNVAGDGDRHLLVQEMKFTMKEVEGNWQIIRVETVKTLNSAPRVTPPETSSAA
jgi:hypothetical protein